MPEQRNESSEEQDRRDDRGSPCELMRVADHPGVRLADPTSQVQDHPLRVLEALLDPDQEGDRLAAVDDAVIV